MNLLEQDLYSEGQGKTKPGVCFEVDPKKTRTFEVEGGGAKKTNKNLIEVVNFL